MKLNKRFIILLGLMLIFSMALVACRGEEGTAPKDDTTGEAKEEAQGEAADEPQYGGDLIYGQIGNPQVLNPMYSQDAASGNIEDLIFAGLMRTNEELEMVPHLGEPVEVSEDGLEHVYRFYKGVKWHDGEEVTADDVVFTFSIPLHEDYDGPRKSYFENLESVEKIDDYTVKFILKRPDAAWPVNAGWPLLPEHILGDVSVAELGEHTFNRDPIGAGPFKFDEWVEGQYVRLVAHEDYFEGRPYLDSITVKITGDTNAQVLQLQTGDIDMGVFPSEEFATVETFDHVKISQVLRYAYNFFGFNFRNEFFQDHKVRQAFAYAIDRQAIIDVTLEGYGEVAHGPVSPLSWAWTDDLTVYEYDPGKAKTLLAEAGWEPGPDGILVKDGQKFEIEILYNEESNARRTTAVIIQDQLAEIGIKATPKSLEWGAFVDTINPPRHEFDTIILSWNLGTDPNPYHIFHSGQIDEGLNYGSYVNEELDQLMEAVNLEMDEAKRTEKLHEIFKILSEDLPYVFLNYPMENVAYPINLHGFIHHPSVPFYKADDWWLEQ
ncbi:peptide/nickel transport system substrate-binding protein [Caldalkalibacillus uzonensis]|uniref:Peptide/nickel transport system substrate-binding protein n=1 Tax=Caldalkalibacillus uzonensis TaxID=353224 RepID=A0ABU0CW94_9BACI|nr:peptide-binding protein [Caldalkalibacillus uzonensis]MDQ0340604.1 peptide/nickel transport system substrate-binding protein [Caldalkalibacillus uzonensis]